MARLLKQMLGIDRPFVPSQHLRPDGWCDISGIGRMSLVWPWYAEADPQPLVDSYGRDAGTTPKLALRAPRSDRDLGLIVWSESTSGVVVGPEWGRSVLALYPGSRMEQNSVLNLASALGRMARVADQRDTTWRVVVPREMYVVHMEVSVPTVHADAYWIQVETMLSTWAWSD